MSKFLTDEIGRSQVYTVMRKDPGTVGNQTMHCHLEHAFSHFDFGWAASSAIPRLPTAFFEKSANQNPTMMLFSDMFNPFSTFLLVKIFWYISCIPIISFSRSILINSDFDSGESNVERRWKWDIRLSVISRQSKMSGPEGSPSTATSIKSSYQPVQFFSYYC